MSGVALIDQRRTEWRMIAADDVDTLTRLGKHGAQLVSSEVVQYKDAYRLCYIRGPEGLLIGFGAADQLAPS